MRLTFTAPLWLWKGQAPAAWHFVTLPPEEAGLIRMALPRGRARGWGSVRIRAMIGGTSFSTSLFPDRKTGSFLLPVKAEVRAREGLASGHDVTVSLSLDL